MKQIDNSNKLKIKIMKNIDYSAKFIQMHIENAYNNWQVSDSAKRQGIIPVPFGSSLKEMMDDSGYTEEEAYQVIAEFLEGEGVNLKFDVVMADICNGL